MCRDRFPRAMLSLIAGHGGLGKTTVLLDMAARITRGSTWPDGDGAAKRGSVIYFSGEDSIEHTLLPRFLAAMGDPERIHFIPAVKREDGEGNPTALRTLRAVRIMAAVRDGERDPERLKELALDVVAKGS